MDGSSGATFQPLQVASLSGTLAMCSLCQCLVCPFKEQPHAHMCTCVAESLLRGEKAWSPAAPPHFLHESCISSWLSPPPARSDPATATRDSQARPLPRPELQQAPCFSGIRRRRVLGCVPRLALPGASRSSSLTLGLFICVRHRVPPHLSLQFHHVPLYLEWAPMGVFSSSAPQREEPQDTPVEPAEKDRAEPEPGES